jgi:hypothetical protein
MATSTLDRCGEPVISHARKVPADVLPAQRNDFFNAQAREALDRGESAVAHRSLSRASRTRRINDPAQVRSIQCRPATPTTASLTRHPYTL